MTRYTFTLILAITFSFHGCTDNDDDLKGDSSIKFTEKFEMTEWQLEPLDNGVIGYHYYRFEIDYPLYIKHWYYLEFYQDLDADCFLNASDITLKDTYPNPEVTILENTENYLKIEVKLSSERLQQYTFTYKNGRMERHIIDMGVNLGTKYWDKSEIDLSTLDVCATSH